MQQVHPGLAGVLPGAGGDYAEVGGGGDGVVVRGEDVGAGEEGGGVLEVEHLAARLVGVGVDEGELVGEVLGEDGLGYGHADVAGSDDGDLGGFGWGGRRGDFLGWFEEGLGYV